MRAEPRMMLIAVCSGSRPNTIARGIPRKPCACCTRQRDRRARGDVVEIEREAGADAGGYRRCLPWCDLAQVRIVERMGIDLELGGRRAPSAGGPSTPRTRRRRRRAAAPRASLRARRRGPSAAGRPARSRRGEGAADTDWPRSAVDARARRALRSFSSRCASRAASRARACSRVVGSAGRSRAGPARSARTCADVRPRSSIDRPPRPRHRARTVS